jgi:hypothetical protein
MLVLWDDTYFERLWCSFPKSESTFLGKSLDGRMADGSVFSCAEVTFVGQNMHAGHDYI